VDGIEITDIKITKKGRYALFCGDEFLFSVDEDMMARHEIYIGCTIDKIDLELFKKEADLSKALERAFTVVSSRNHSRKELFDKLTQKYDEYTADYCIEKLTGYGYIDEEGFARECVDMFRRRNMSEKQARQYLNQKGISRELTDMVLDGYADDEQKRVRAVIEKKYMKKMQESPQKVAAALYAKGYSASAVRAAMNSLETEYEE